MAEIKSFEPEAGNAVAGNSKKSQKYLYLL